QFESFVHPLIIMVTVPLALLGAVFGLKLFGLTINIFSQIAVIMLVGIAAKNGVLIVEFANQLRDRGVEFVDAIVQAAAIRLRPVLMTGFCTASGALPLLLAHGADDVVLLRCTGLSRSARAQRAERASVQLPCAVVREAVYALR